jgi:IS605 OrfB family transposase
LNYCLTQWWLWQDEKEKLKQQTGRYPTSKEFSDPSSKLYSEVRKMYPEMPSRMASTITKTARDKWRSVSKDVFYRLDMSLPTFKKGYPIPVDNQLYALSKSPEGICMSVTLRSKIFDGTKRFHIILQQKKFGNSQREILKKMIDKTYRRAGAQIARDRNGDIYVRITYEPPKRETNLDPNRIIGIDLGIKNAFYCALNDGMKRLSPRDSMELFEFRQQIKKRRRSYQHQSRVSTRGGAGRNKILRPLDKLSEKEKRFRDTKYHQYTRQIIDFALDNSAGKIQMEELDSLKKEKQGQFLLNDWAIADFQTKLKYKAEDMGIEVAFVNAQYTSQRCSSCGYIDKKNRSEQERFKCLKCGFEENADYNAAKNLSIPNIDAIIETEIANLKRTDEIPEFRGNSELQEKTID